MKKILTILIVAAIILMSVGSLVSCAGEEAAPAKAVVLRLAIPWPPGDPVTNNIENFVNAFNKEAAGKYVIEVHPGESLVKIGDSMDALRTGAVEMCGWPIGVFGSLDPLFAAAELPFAANNVEADAAMAVEMMPVYDGIMTKKFNSKPIFTFTCLALDVISVKPMKTQADWKGVLTQSVSPQSAKFIEMMGGSSVPMPFPDGYQGLQKKVIEASTQSSSMMIMFKMNEVAKYVLRGYLIPASLMVGINMNAYNRMPKDMQNLIVKLGKQAQIDTNKFFINVAQENTKTLTNLGMNVYHLPKAERDAWAKILKPYSDELLNAMGADTAQKIKKIVEDVNKKYPYQE